MTVTDEEIRDAVSQIRGDDCDSYDMSEVVKNVRALIDREVAAARQEERYAADERVDTIYMDYPHRD